MKAVVAAFGMGFWSALLGWGAWWLLVHGRWLMAHQWPFVGLAVFAFGCMLMAVCGRGAYLVWMVLSGRTSPRLARRDFRNSLSNLAMFMKTGMWKW